MARRFLFSLTGGYGHFHPLVPLAKALERAGHTVAFAAGPSMLPLVTAAGFRFLQTGASRDRDPEYLDYRAHLDQMAPGLESELFIYSRLFCSIAPRLKLPGLLETAQSWKPDVLVREGAEYAAPIAAELLGLPHITVAFAAALKSMVVFEREAAAGLDPLRQHFGLPPDPELAALYRFLYLSCSPPGFSLQQVESPPGGEVLPSTLRFARLGLFDQSGPEKLPGWFASLPPRPTIYVTLGTEINSSPQYYPAVLKKIIDGLSGLDLNLIVTLGRGRDPADFGPQPPNVHLERYLPQSLLLPQCDLAVIHGGSNTLLAALDLGLPVVVVPLIADQFFNARALQGAGVGKVVPLELLAPASIRAAVEEVRANPLYRLQAASLKAEMHALPGPEFAVRLVENLAEKGRG